MTQTGMVMGTPQYLSPEQALGKAVDHRSDLYATGCLLYELLALRPPFIGETPLSVVYQHVQDIPVPPSQTSGGECPPELDGLVMRSLAKDPDDRFQTAEEMRGLVQYGLQMLYDQGGHTGTWNTGPVAVTDGRGTPSGGFASTTVLPHGADGSHTSQIPQPILPTGYGGGDDGGFEGHGNKGSGRGKLWILAVFAVIAIAAGVALALNNKGGGTGGGGASTSPTVSSPASNASPSTEPSDEESDTSTGDSTDDGTGSNDNHNYSPSYKPSRSPSSSPSQSASDEPTDDQSATPSDKPSDPETDPSPPASPDPTGGADQGTTTLGGAGLPN
jgi:serine/threonine protein kinase